MSILMVLLFTVSCDKKDDTAEKEMGSLGGKCYPAGNCDEDLVCEDGVCVKDDSVITDDDFETQDEVETEDSDPVDLCDPNPCTMNNSDGECTVEGEDYFCGCEENYTWDGEEKKCSPDIRRTECTNEIPENASYSGDNSDGKFEQVWDGSRWLPEDYSCLWECDEDFFEENDLCINSRTLLCDDTEDLFPENAVVFDGVEVEITYTTDGGWEDVSQCEWECEEGYVKHNGSCVKNQMVDCLSNPDKPENSVDVIEPVEITYTEEDGWTTADLCENWECMTDYAEENGACINSKMADCLPNPDKPLRSVDVVEQVEITYTEEDGWSDPAKCIIWECAYNYVFEDGACINSQMVDCVVNPNKPENSVDVIEQVKITYTDDGGWTTADICENWECDTDYTEEEGECINSKMANCLPDPDKPENSLDIIEPVEITYTTEGGWTTADFCEDWECMTNYAEENGACINSQMVDCLPNPDKPENSVDVVEPVEITYTDDGGWTTADICENWECMTNYAEENGACINSKMVDCLSNPDKPENSVDIIEPVAITYTTDDGWTTADSCTDWECASCYVLSPSGEECDFQTVVYVKHDAEGEETGITWEDAHTDLSIVIENVCEGQDLWVAQGIYHPSADSSLPDGTAGEGRERHFTLRNGVTIYGGFDGVSYDFVDRDWETYETVLSGDFDNNDVWNDVEKKWENNEENAYHVFYHSNFIELDETAVIDGFTIKGGNADGEEFPHNSGGGMMNENYNSTGPTVRNCRFYGNSASFNGGGIYYAGTTVVIEDSVFTSNISMEGSGSAIYSDDGILLISGTQFIENYAFERGAVYADKGEVEIYESRFAGNFSGTGGGAFVSSESSVLIQDSYFEGNQTAGNGGAILNRLNSYQTIINSVFKDNFSSEMGGAIANFAASSYIRNCTLSQNHADEGGSIVNGGYLFPINSISWDNHSVSFADEILHLSEGSEVDGLVLGEVSSRVSYSNIAGCGTSGVDWNDDCGIDSGNNIDTDPMFVGIGDDPLMLSAGSPSIDTGNNTFVDGILTDILGNPRIANDIVDMGAYEYQF